MAAYASAQGAVASLLVIQICRMMIGDVS